MLINIGPGNATRLNSIPSCSALPFLNLPLPSLPLHLLACLLAPSISRSRISIFNSRSRCLSKINLIPNCAPLCPFCSPFDGKGLFPSLSLSLSDLLCSQLVPSLPRCIWLQNVCAVVNDVQLGACDSRPQQALHVTF